MSDRVEASATSSALAAANAALARGALPQALVGYTAAVEQSDTAEALEGLGRATWWSNDAEASMAARQRAYCLRRRDGDALGAARMALHLGVEWLSLRDAQPVARWWLKRAECLLEGLEVAPEHAWVALWQAQAAMVGADVCAADRLSAGAVELARTAEVVSLEKLALAQLGLCQAMAGAVAASGDVVSPRDLYDDAFDPDTLALVGAACSQLMYWWEELKDFESIEAWWAVVESVPPPWSSGWVFWLCRIQRCSALMWRGEWDEAEAQLAGSIKALEGTRDDIAAEAMARLGRLGRRQGRYVEAAALVEQARCAPLRVRSDQQALWASVELALDHGEDGSIGGLLDHVLADFAGSRLGVSALEPLALLVQAQLSCDDHSDAQATLGRLQRAACALASDGVRASVRYAEGMVAVCMGAFATAVDRLEEAVSLLERAGGRFDAAQARFELAVALAGAGRQDSAMRHAASAMECLSALGACRQAERAQRRLPTPPAGYKTTASTKRSNAGLTARELEILHLVARGRTNLAIASQLSMSVRTVERHLSNIYEKVGASGKTARAASVAYALRHGVLSERG